jgi:hypothetical protein
MLRKICVVAAGIALLGMTALPASAATASHPKVHSFTVPAATGVSAWGSYYTSGGSVHVTLCVKETARNVDFALATGVALNANASRHQQVTAEILGTGKQVCRTMTTKDTRHLYAQVTSGTSDGHAHIGKMKRIY